MKNDIRAALIGLGYQIPEQQVYSNIATWREWYQGYSAKFHDYMQYNGRRKIKRRRKSLRMAKRVCEDHANLLLNEKVQITIDNTAAQAAVDKALEANGFRVKGNKLVEVAFALGTGAFVEHDDGQGGVLIDYVRADMIFPTKWENEDVTDCLFASIKNVGTSSVLYLNEHRKVGAEYVIYNRMFQLDANGNVAQRELTPGNKRPAELTPEPDTGLLAGDIVPEFHTRSEHPRFQFISPNSVNNTGVEGPLGMSVFANSIDVLEGVDLIYDSYCSEFRLGKKRIIIPQSMLQLMQDDQGPWMAFDDNDTEFYGLKDDNLTDIKEINMELRTEAHDQAMQQFLNLLSAKTGLGNDRYQFDRGGGVKTTTEVISEKSELFQNRQKNSLVLEAALKGICQAIAEISGITGALKVEINFDDSIIEDTEGKRARMQALVTQGKFPLWRYLFEYEGYTKEDAEAIALEVAAAEPDPLAFGNEETDPQV